MSTIPKGYPRGWFVVAWSSELAAGDVKPLQYFGKHLVLFRTASGSPHLLDAFCPHLGAHLGHGGKIDGERIVCPFHAWAFDGEGICQKIPYSERVPKRARTHAHRIVERNGCVYLWHDPAGGEPDWEVPVIESYGSDAWTPWHENMITVRTHPREIVENVADKQHFPVVHRTEVERFDNIYDGHKATQITVGSARPPQGGIDHFQIEAVYHGPGFQISDMDGVLHSRLLLAHTPIDTESLHLRFAVSLERSGPRTEEFARFYVENLRLGFHEDISIWEHKVYRDRPQLHPNDGPVGRLRAWYRQFYSTPEKAEAATASR